MKVGSGLVLSAVLAAMAFPVHAQTPPATPGTAAALADTAARVRERALSGSGAYDILESLTTETGPRPAGSPAFARAKDWAIAKLTSLGFKNVHAEPFTILGWYKGVETAEVTAPFPQPLVITGLGRSVSTPPEGIEAEVVIFRTFEELQAAPPNSLTGKIAVLTEKMGSNDSPTGYGVANRWRRKGPVEAGKRGAVGFLLRSLATNDDRSPHSGALNYDDDAPKIPAAALSGADADQIERIAKRGKPIRIHFILRPTIEPAATTWNVVGEIPGRVTPDEVVLVSGHLDSWGLGTGAIDDGAGVAITLAAAHLAGERHPRRTIRMVMWGAEETDYAGEAYAKAHAADAGKIVIAGESDNGAQHEVGFGVPAGGAGLPAVETLAQVLQPLGVTFNPMPVRQGGDDVGHLVPLGVPQLGMRQENSHYFDIHHTAEDTLDKVDPVEMDKATAAWAAAIWVLAESGVDFRKAAPPKAK
ncbi:MAG TPA: M28 family peptidase [Caulobacteraceae bacterium]|jgi:hypothetical protein